ncbi:alpha/beta hydrolase domain-containing protein [Aerococcus kribbianus]|uniref:Alpha/beta hydrolase domain-containing protein n=1 Tax=Aerococcus kribbianus TaxID=2999064 RepID=A0A9X3JFE1_9LACT|nr:MULTISPECIES: alpha/beta hydrolase domain-containing protein [unclassified Aerococcus]MCZ0717528.1 alpha/beta hydrolase domain-containing protein [Aerococcus sp. YH-aer221]MCZ0725816.1 alpha/beta hydrolase domain-containing protein [Aerococcus sp. YH-aer222]
MNQDINDTIKQNISQEGPIPITQDSHPFSANAFARQPVDLTAYKYKEEEYFISGKANIYQGEKVAEVKYSNQPYKTRIMIRKPNPDHFSGRVYLDIYNASNGYDIEDVWRRSYQYYLENGHIYIGITSKPINVLSLKNFDYNRYQSLNWSSPETAPMPTTISPTMSIPGTEEGLIWDIISQLGYAIKNNLLEGLSNYPVQELYLTGQSQSGMYLNSYVYYFHQFVENIFDGYLNVVGAGVMRDLNQYENPNSFFSSKKQLLPKQLKRPFILLSSQGDINLFESMVNRNQVLSEINNTLEPIRHYELASSPHTDPASPLIPDNSEIVKTKNPAKLLDGEYNYTVNNIQLAYYVNSCLEALHKWAQEDYCPSENLLINRDSKGHIDKDEFGNGRGGLRSAYVEVPIAHYHANAIEPGYTDKNQSASVNGSMVYFNTKLLQTLYKDKQDYLKKFASYVNQQVKENFLLSNDGKRMIAWSKAVAEELFN